jgi:DNA-binding transcriptional LysR family regulator
LLRVQIKFSLIASSSAGAIELNMSLAVVSKRLARLESWLGVRLINRTTRNLGMTDEGKEFYKRCVGILTACLRVRAAAGYLGGNTGCQRNGRRNLSALSQCVCPIAAAIGRFYQRVNFSVTEIRGHQLLI